MIEPQIEETAAATLTRRVLVVDDEESIRLLLKEYLELSGLEVCTALSGTEALRLLRERPFDLVLCDVSMPGMDGFDVFERVQETHPGQKFLFISGYAFAGSRKKLLQKSMGLLTKPFHLNDLNRIMMEVFPDL
ncbi:MAG: response regulator [Candidatus Zixiibacteriota bacterium]|nr:MAG: response regulator [candidate division Zixibacteria bacterium]